MNAEGASPRLLMPRFWIAFSLLAWGWFTDNLPGAAVMALLLEAIGLMSMRWVIANGQFHRAADLTSVVFVLVSAVMFSRHSVHGVYAILAATPYCFFPLILIQSASTEQSMPMSALFYSLRRHPEFTSRLDFTPAYMALCLLAATTNTDQRSEYFTIVVAFLMIGLLFLARPQRYRWWAWALSLGVALLLALLTQYSYLRGHRALEASLMYWISQFAEISTDPTRAVTSMGAIGRLKLSDQIRIRIAPDPSLRLPIYLQEASYDVFTFGSWSAENAEFDALAKSGENF